MNGVSGVEWVFSGSSNLWVLGEVPLIEHIYIYIVLECLRLIFTQITMMPQRFQTQVRKIQIHTQGIF